MFRKTLIIFILFTIMFLPYAYSQVTSWIIVDRTGNWENAEPTNLSTKLDSEDAYITFRASNIRLGYLKTTFVIDLSGSAELIGGELKLRIEELDITISYKECYKPGIFGFNEYINNSIYIYAGGNEYYLSDEAYSPKDTRLNTRLYIWIWRSDKDKISWVVSDGYLQRNGINNIYLNGTIPYNGEELTLTLSAKKWVIGGKGKLHAYLIYNDIDASGNVFSNFELSVIDYGFNSFFYASLSFFIVVITGQILYKILLKELRVQPEKAVSRRKRR